MSIAMNSVAKWPGWIRWGAIGLVVAGAATTAFLVFGPKTPTQNKFAKFLTKAELLDTDIRITSAGQVFPNRKVNVGPKEGGVLAELYVEQGDEVTQGQALARMDISRVVSEVAGSKAAMENARARYLELKNGPRRQEMLQVKATLRSDQASYRIAQNNYERYEKLSQDGGLTEDELNAKRASFEQAKASLENTKERLRLLEEGTRYEQILGAKAAYEQAQAQYRDSQTRFNDLTIRAPFTGIVSQRFTQAGSFVSPTTNTQGASANSSSILLLIDRLEVLATVAESDISRIKVGQPVLITSSAFPGQEFKGKVRLVAPEAVEENGITQFQVRIILDDRAATTLKSRLNVSLNFIAGRIENALVVPTTAVISKDGKTGVLIPDATKGPTYKEVTTGQSLGDKTQILTGLKTGEQLFSKLPPDVNIEEILGKSNAFR